MQYSVPEGPPASSAVLGNGGGRRGTGVSCLLTQAILGVDCGGASWVLCGESEAGLTHGS